MYLLCLCLIFVCLQCRCFHKAFSALENAKNTNIDGEIRNFHCREHLLHLWYRELCGFPWWMVELGGEATQHSVYHGLPSCHCYCFIHPYYYHTSTTVDIWCTKVLHESSAGVLLCPLVIIPSLVLVLVCFKRNTVLVVQDLLAI